MCCPCCSINQVYQTTLQRGNPFQSHGRSYNVNPFLMTYPQCELCSCDIFRSFFCIPCVIADILHDSISMPWYMACLFVHPCAMRNLYRYQHHIEGDDDCTELSCSILQGQIFPSQSFQYLFWIFNSCMILQILQDARMRRYAREFANFLIDLETGDPSIRIPSAPPQPTPIDSSYIQII